MSNIDAVNALLTAIHFDRFSEIEARHQPDVTFWSFRGPTLRDSVSVADWHRTFLRDYADCSYTEIEPIEQGNEVAVRATLTAKGYDWRPFTQRVLEVFDMENEGILGRRLYGMLRDIELDKPTNAALENALGARGGSAAATKKAVDSLYDNLLAGNVDAALELFDPKAALIDSVYGIVNGPQNILDLLRSVPAPAFGIWRRTNTVAGATSATVELAIDPQRPRAAHWLRMSDGKIKVIEVYWMLREIGLKPEENYARDRHQRQVILPI